MKKLLSLLTFVFLFSTSCSKGRAAHDDEIDIEDEKYFVEYLDTNPSKAIIPEDQMII
jgi:hypothetical protein